MCPGIFPGHIHVTPKYPLLHGLLIKSIFLLHSDCKLHAGAWVLLLQLIPPLCPTPLVSKALF